MTPYEYSPLDEDALEIRLMTLLPGRFEDDISITIEREVLAEDHIPDYEALSYVWGSRGNPVDISVKALEPEHPETFALQDCSIQRRPETCRQGTIPVTQNLAMALPYLRKEYQPRIFWIDAICVNQQDLAERGQQVKRMAAVYSMASQVIVWLGPESRNSTLALRALDDLGSQVRIDWYIRKMILVSTGETITRGINPFNDNEIWESVGDLLRRPWFERLWIWQEVRLAKAAYLFCGNVGVSWDSFRKAVFYLEGLAGPEGIGPLIERCYKISDYSGNIADIFDNLERVLGTARSASCSDPRDRIFAVLGLARKSDTRGLDPDYSKPAEAVYQDLVLHFTFNLQSLNILIHCELQDDTNSISLPTWVPNWSVPRLCETSRGSSSCWNSKPRVRYHDGSVLAATGIQIAIIKGVETLPQPASPDRVLFKNEIEDAIQTLIIPKIKSLSPPERDMTVSSLCRTICYNEFADGYLPPYLILLSFEKFQQYTYRIIDTTQDTALDDSQESQTYLARVMSAIRGRSFFTTDDGYIGLAPIATKPDDEVCILLGCQSPLVLRPCGNGSRKVVGQCYIDGFMEGTACLGPLPGKWQPVQRYFEEFSRDYPAFLDHQTGEFQIEDPRLGPLPVGWYIHNHQRQNALNLYANDETGERTWFDPRMTPEALTARGVELREFQLI